MKWIVSVAVVCASLLALVQCQDYAEYNRGGAALGRRRNNRFVPFHTYKASMHFFSLCAF
jgi:hypothetical protein